MMPTLRDPLEPVMLGNKKLIRKPDPLMLLILLVSMGVFMTAAVDAGETFFTNPSLTDLLDGDVRLAEAGRGDVGLHMSFQAPASVYEGMQADNRNQQQSVSLSNVYLSVRLPW